MKANRTRATEVSFLCPGCGESHEVSDAPGRWTFNGDFDKPTFSPSLLRTTGHFVSTHKPGEDNCWCTYDAEHPDQPSGFACARCHSFVRDGRIQFLSDCTHSLAGQTVDLPEWPS